jgi:hypothetical protein
MRIPGAWAFHRPALGDGLSCPSTDVSLTSWRMPTSCAACITFGFWSPLIPGVTRFWMVYGFRPRFRID